MKDNETVLLINISKILESFHHVLRKEDGFRSYFATNPKKINILKSDIRNTDYASIKKTLKTCFSENNIKVVFVTNSRVFYVAKFIKEENIKGVSVIGFDFTEKNIKYLVDGDIDFLICQKSQEQGYRGIITLANYMVRNEQPKKTNYMPIDIITRENYKYYDN